MKTLTETIKTCEMRLENHDMTTESRQRERDVWYHLTQYKTLREAIAKSMRHREPTAITLEEAIQAWADGKRVTLKFDRCEYAFCGFSDQANTRRAINGGTWYVED